LEGVGLALGDDEFDGWYRWRPERADSPAYEDIAEAVENFEPLDRDAGHMSAKWLKEQSLKDYPSTATWILYQDQRVQGYIAICSGNVTLHDSGRANAFRRRLSGLPGVRYAGELVPASEIRWIAKHVASKFDGKVLLAQAIRVAERVAEFQGNIALVVDPYDDETAEMLKENFSFLWSAKKGQLWLRLPAPKLPAV
jgi:hypothetical protein